MCIRNIQQYNETTNIINAWHHIGQSTWGNFLLLVQKVESLNTSRLDSPFAIPATFFIQKWNKNNFNRKQTNENLKNVKIT